MAPYAPAHVPSQLPALTACSIRSNPPACLQKAMHESHLHSIIPGFPGGFLAQPWKRLAHLCLGAPARPSIQALRSQPSKQQRTLPDLRTPPTCMPGVQPQGVPRQSSTCLLVVISEVTGRGCYLVEEKYLIPILITRVSSENPNPEVARSEESGLTSPHCLLEILVLAISLAPRWCPNCQKGKSQS